MPSTSKASVRKEAADWDNDEHQGKSSLMYPSCVGSHWSQDGKQGSNRDKDHDRGPRNEPHEDKYGTSRHRPRNPSVDSRDGARDQQLVKQSKSLRHNRRDDRSESDSESKHKSRREQKNKELIKSVRSHKGKQRNDASESESESDHRERHQSKSTKKESKAIVKYKSSRQREESESESESDHPRQRKEKSTKNKSKALVKASKPRRHQESDPESSNEEIVEKRKRYEEINFHELTRGYVETIANIWEVTPNKVETWCDDLNLIRLDTKDGSINLDKLIKKEPVETSHERMLASFLKGEKRWIAENPGGYMVTIPRFNKGHQGGPSHRRPDVIVIDRAPVVPMITGPTTYYDARCKSCNFLKMPCNLPNHSINVQKWIMYGGHIVS